MGGWRRATSPTTQRCCGGNVPSDATVQQGATVFSVSIILAIVCALVVLALLGVGSFLVLLKLGVIVREASRSAYQDHSSYTLDQGREVRPEEEQQRETSRF